MAGIAFVASDGGTLQSKNFNEVVLLRLNVVEPGVYVVFGRVVVANHNFAIRAARGRITHADGSRVVDSVEVTLASGCSQTLHLQGPLRVPTGGSEIVDIRCSGFDGDGAKSSLFAVQVDQLRLSTL